MDLKLLERMGPAELRSYAEFLLWHYRVIDGLWFLFVQEKLDHPEADRLAVVAALDYDRKGRLKNSRFGRAVINNQARLTYRLVQRLLDGKDRKLRAQYRPFLKMLEWMAELCLLLRGRRGERGSLLMSIPEAEVVLDERGWPTDILRVDHLLAHQIIEEFMIAANEAVSEFIGEPQIFRVHERPDAAKMEAFRAFVKSLASPCPRRPTGTPGCSGTSSRRCRRRRTGPWCSSCSCAP